MAGKIDVHSFDNGLTLVAESMDALESASFSFMLQCGAVNDPESLPGLSSLTCELALRGSGESSSRQFIERLDNLGVERHESVGSVQTHYNAAMLSANLSKTLSIYGDLLLHPHMEEEQLPAGKMVLMQEILSLEDDPSRKVIAELRKRFHPHPLGLPGCGTLEGVQSMTIDQIRRQYREFYRPERTILAVAGNFDWNELRDTTAAISERWKAGEATDPTPGETGPRSDHLPHDSAQTHIAIACPSVPYRDPDYFLAWSGVGILSGGMSSRLFHEVREKRGLCYTVGATYHSHRDRGGIFAYAGTGSKRAQETLDVMIDQMRLLREGITPEELERLKIRAKSALIMQQESSAARSGSVARDWYHLGRVRTFEEIESMIEQLSLDSVNQYLAEHPLSDFHVMTLGPEPLEVPFDLS